jgi:hypothetical protein
MALLLPDAQHAHKTTEINIGVGVLGLKWEVEKPQSFFAALYRKDLSMILLRFHTADNAHLTDFLACRVHAVPGEKRKDRTAVLVLAGMDRWLVILDLNLAHCERTSARRFANRCPFHSQRRPRIFNFSLRCGTGLPAIE